MCGIHGLIRFDGARAAPAMLSAMGDVTRHRGPDDEGMHIDGPCGIAMRRLSIIDVAGGHQPLSNADQTLWLECNGARQGSFTDSCPEGTTDYARYVNVAISKPFTPTFRSSWFRGASANGTFTLIGRAGIRVQ